MNRSIEPGTTQPLETAKPSVVQPADARFTNEERPSRFAALRWGLFVTAFLIGQIYLGYSAVRYANSDGGARPIEGAEAEVARSYEALAGTRPDLSEGERDVR